MLTHIVPNYENIIINNLDNVRIHSLNMKTNLYYRLTNDNGNWYMKQLKYFSVSFKTIDALFNKENSAAYRQKQQLGIGSGPNKDIINYDTVRNEFL